MKKIYIQIHILISFIDSMRDQLISVLSIFLENGAVHLHLVVSCIRRLHGDETTYLYLVWNYLYLDFEYIKMVARI